MTVLVDEAVCLCDHSGRLAATVMDRGLCSALVSDTRTLCGQERL